MAQRTAGRPTSGRVRKDRSLTALYSFVCWELEQRRNDMDFLVELGVDLAPSAVHNSANPRRWRPGVEPPDGDPLFRAWQLVDEPRLGIRSAVVRAYLDQDQGGSRVPTSRALVLRDEVLAFLERLDGIRQILGAESGELVIAIVLYDDRDDADRLRAQLRELPCPWDWDEVGRESWSPAPSTWRRLTRRVAAREGLVR